MAKKINVTKWVSNWMETLLPENEPVKEQNLIFAAFILNLKTPKNSKIENVEEKPIEVEKISEKIEIREKVKKEKVEDSKSIKCNKFVRRFRKTQRPVRI